jgi:hypothetical protein
MSDMGGQNRRCWPISFLSGRPLRIIDHVLLHQAQLCRVNQRTNLPETE